MLVDVDAAIDRGLKRIHNEHYRAYRVTETLFKVVSASSRQYTDPKHKKGLKHTKRLWHYVTCVEMPDGRVKMNCNGEHCEPRYDEFGNNVCVHVMCTGLRLIRNPQEVEAVRRCTRAVKEHRQPAA